MSTNTLSTGTDYSDTYQQELATLDSISDPSLALEYCMCTLLPSISDSYEASIGDEGDTLNDLSQMQSDTNTIQTAYNQSYQVDYDADMRNKYSQGSDEWNQWNEKYQQDNDVYQHTDVPAAVAADNDIMNILAANPDVFSSISSDINTQLTTIFGQNPYPIQPNYGGLEQSWNTDWSYAAANAAGYNDGTSGTQNEATTAIQPNNDAFTSLQSDFSGVSSSTQAEMQYNESNDQQMQGLIETSMQYWAKGDQTMVNNLAPN